MTMLAITPFTLKQSRLNHVLERMRTGSPLLFANAAAMFLFFVVCMVLQFIDARSFNGANVWMKPAKFFLSLSVHFGTVAWALSFASFEVRQSRTVTWTNWAMVASAWYELIYISLRAARGEASHFNTDSLTNAILYQLMALGAVVLVLGAAIIGWTLWRRMPKSLWTEAIAMGFGLSAVLALIVGFTLGSNSGHWIGGDMTDVTGLPIFKWSTTGGDLRVAHFIGLHAMQVVPFAAMSGRRSVVYGVALLTAIATALTFLLALSGTPLFRL